MPVPPEAKVGGWLPPYWASLPLYGRKARKYLLKSTNFVSMRCILAQAEINWLQALQETDWQQLLTSDLLALILEKVGLVLLAILLLWLGFKLTRFPVRLIKAAMRRAKLDASLTSFLASLCSFAIKVLIIVLVAAMVGIETSAFVAIIGAAGLAIGLALQGSLANFAGGVLILVFKPFVVGDIVIHDNQEGVVEYIDILYSHIRKYDNQLVVAPNGALANNLLINLSKMPLRRVEIPIRISYDSDIKQARKLVLEVFEADGRVVDDPAPQFLMMNMQDHYLAFSARGWSTMDDYWPVYWDCLEAIKEAFQESEAVSIPLPQRIVELPNQEQGNYSG